MLFVSCATAAKSRGIVNAGQTVCSGQPSIVMCVNAHALHSARNARITTMRRRACPSVVPRLPWLRQIELWFQCQSLKYRLSTLSCFSVSEKGRLCEICLAAHTNGVCYGESVKYSAIEATKTTIPACRQLGLSAGAGTILDTHVWGSAVHGDTFHYHPFVRALEYCMTSARIVCFII